MCAVSPARSETSSYTAWGHSTVVNPWGEVIATTEHDPAIVSCDLDLNYLSEVRQQIPVLHRRRMETTIALPK